MRIVGKIAFVLVVALMLSLRCINSKKTKNKSLKKLSHVGHKKEPQQRSQTGQKKNAVQPTNIQATVLANADSLDSNERNELDRLQNFNKLYLNNDMAAETAALADQGIDDDSALKISNMAAFPAANHAAGDAAIKAKINSGFSRDTSAAPNQQASTGYDPNAYLYDKNSWPEYSIHDSDYSNYRTFEMNGLMDGGYPDMMFGHTPGPNRHRAMHFGKQRPLYGSTEAYGDSDQGPKQDTPTKNKASHVKLNFGSHVESESSPTKDKTKLLHNGTSEEDSKPEGVVIPPIAATQHPRPLNTLKAENSSLPEDTKDATPPKQQQDPASLPHQRPQQETADSAKFAASVVQAPASMSPKAIASLVRKLVGEKGLGGATLGQIQDKISGAVSHVISHDVNMTEPLKQAATQIQKVSKSKGR